MKSRLLYLSLSSVLTGFAKGQTGKGTVMFGAKIPVVVEAGYYRIPPAYNNRLYLLSKDFRIILPKRGTEVVGDHYVPIGALLDFSKLSSVQYAIINGSNTSIWQDIRTGVVLDSAIRVSDSIKLQFRIKGQSVVFEEIIIARKEILPVINSYRELNPEDSLAHNSRSDFASRKKLKSDGLKYIDHNVIVVKPGKYPQLFVNEMRENKDSSLQFRLRKLGDNSVSDWKFTGHTLNLNSVTSDNNYILDIRYIGMDTHISYNIRALPFWHQLLWVRILLAVLTTILATLTYKLIRRFKLKNKHRDLALLAAELKNNRNKLDPHFIFNCLGTAQSLIEEGKSAEASSYLDDFSDLLRGALTNSHLEMISLAGELEVISRYITIQQQRYRFQFNLSIDPGLNTEQIQFPVMLLQPTVENAIKHGVAHIGFEGIISLRVENSNGHLTITVTDNGNLANAAHSSGTGNGIKITSERIEHLKRINGRSQINYERIHSVSGTIVRFTLENWFE